MSLSLCYIHSMSNNPVDKYINFCVNHEFVAIQRRDGYSFYVSDYTFKEVKLRHFMGCGLGMVYSVPTFLKEFHPYFFRNHNVISQVNCTQVYAILLHRNALMYFNKSLI